ncbi:MAG TPA: glycosyltransferase family 39 protein [Agriterribacter sp.]|nr:glycosyltransferase family 39 protein [Agriterribacter sp.]
MLSLLRKHRLVFYTSWLLINLFQAYSTELIDDEAYYWIYSRFPDWGYFDHPPAIAILIKAGFAIFHNELGVRLFAAVLNTLTIFIIDQLIEKKNDLLFYAIVASMVITQIGGIIAAPDAPLLFFTASFFWLYKKFLQQMDLRNIILLGINIALLVYSKYHGALIVFCTLLSNPKLFTKHQTWSFIGIAFLLFIPHLYWQYYNNFPTIRFHLLERNASYYHPSFTIEYILGQLALAGPLVGWLLIWVSLRYKPANLTERAMKFSVAGIYLVFLLASFKGRVEANWTVAAFVPLIVLSHQYLLDKRGWRIFLYRTVPVTLLLVLALRIYMISDVPVHSWMPKDEFHQNKVRANVIHQKAKQKPVIFIDSYQQASKYWFYSGVPGFSINSPYYRLNNFNLWPLEDSLIGKPVWLQVAAPDSAFQSFFYKNNWTFPHSGIINDYYSFGKVAFSQINTNTSRGAVQIYATANIPAGYLDLFQLPQYSQTGVWLAIYNDEDNVENLFYTGFTVKQLVCEKQKLIITLPQKFAPGKYIGRLCIGSCLQGFPTINSPCFYFEADFLRAS